MKTFFHAAIFCLTLITASKAEEAALTYDSLFGADTRRVTSTTTKTDDVEFARKLLDHAGSLNDEPNLEIYLYVKSYETAMRDALGYPIAIEASKAVLRMTLDARSEWEEKLLSSQRALFKESTGYEQRAVGRELIETLRGSGKAFDESSDFSDAANRYREAYRIEMKFPSVISMKFSRS